MDVENSPGITTLNQTLLHGPVLIDGHAAEPGESKVPQASWVLHDERIGSSSLATNTRPSLQSEAMFG
jgi:hypothetical protein